MRFLWCLIVLAVILGMDLFRPIVVTTSYCVECVR